MTREVLLRSQKNQIFDRIVKHGLKPTDFQWAQEASRHGDRVSASRMTYRETEWFFRIDYDHSKAFRNWGCLYLLASQEPGLEQHNCVSFDGVLKHLTKWLSYLKANVAIPDFWAAPERYSPGQDFVRTEDLSDGGFSDYEVQDVTASLHELENQIQTAFDLDEEQSSFVHQQMEYLVGAAKRQNKKDWFHTSIGVITTIAVGLALSPERAKLLWGLVKSCLAGLLQLSAP